jgi:hypothetical protein
MPNEYGVPATQEGMLTWDHVTGLLKDALNYWIATTSADGKPHVRPVWAAWLDGVLYFDGHPATGWGRNIIRDPRISVQVEAGDEVVILEGVVEDIPQAEAELAARIAEGFDAKYATKYNFKSDPGPWRERGLWSLRPQKVLAWDVAIFPGSVTRWRFNNADVEGNSQHAV